MINGRLDIRKLAKTINTAMRMLDNVIDINYYSVPQAKNSNFKHRPIGLGLWDFKMRLYQRFPMVQKPQSSLPIDVWNLSVIMLFKPPAELAEERGTYATF